MRTGWLTTLPLIALLALNGCGNDGDASAPSASSSSSASASPSATEGAAGSASPAEAATASSSATPQPGPSTRGFQNTMPTDDPTAAEATCGEMTAEQALAEHLPEVPQLRKGEQWAWSAETADTAGYRPCAALSWITVGVEGATATSPHQIMLFHQGEFLGPATTEAYGYAPRVERIDDATLQVTYLGSGKHNAETQEDAVSVFKYNPLSGGADRAGDLPRY